MNEKMIWDYLYQNTGNAIGAAAIMGNLMAESSLNPQCATGKNRTANYAKDADNGAVDFVNDGVAFGLVQWCYCSRKKGLLDYAKATGRSVGHLQMQLEYLVKEMSESYKTAWKTVQSTNSIRTASDIVMLQYEKPATTTEAAKQKRAKYGQQFYDQFSGEKRVVATDNVRIRAGNGKNYGKVSALRKGQSLVWVATVDGWHAVAMKDRVGWVSADFSEVRS